MKANPVARTTEAVIALHMTGAVSMRMELLMPGFGKTIHTTPNIPETPDTEHNRAKMHGVMEGFTNLMMVPIAALSSERNIRS